MEYAYATLLLNESNREINEENLTAVLEASGYTVETSRVKALVAALEEVDLDDVADDIDSEGADGTALTAPRREQEGPESKEGVGEDEGGENGVGEDEDEIVDAQTDGGTGTAEIEPDDGATTES